MKHEENIKYFVEEVNRCGISIRESTVFNSPSIYEKYIAIKKYQPKN